VCTTQQVDGSAASLAEWPGLDERERAGNPAQKRARESQRREGEFGHCVEDASAAKDGGFKMQARDDRGLLNVGNGGSPRDQRQQMYWEEEQEGAGGLPEDLSGAERDASYREGGRQRKGGREGEGGRGREGSQASIHRDKVGRTGIAQEKEEEEEEEEKDEEEEEEEESSLHLPRNTEAVLAAAQARRDASVLERYDALMEGHVDEEAYYQYRKAELDRKLSARPLHNDILGCSERVNWDVKHALRFEETDPNYQDPSWILRDVHGRRVNTNGEILPEPSPPSLPPIDSALVVRHKGSPWGTGPRRGGGERGPRSDRGHSGREGRDREGGGWWEGYRREEGGLGGFGGAGGGGRLFDAGGGGGGGDGLQKTAGQRRGALRSNAGRERERGTRQSDRQFVTNQGRESTLTWPTRGLSVEREREREREREAEETTPRCGRRARGRRAWRPAGREGERKRRAEGGSIECEREGSRGDGVHAGPTVPVSHQKEL
jgi:hypothetical protein